MDSLQAFLDKMRKEFEGMDRNRKIAVGAGGELGQSAVVAAIGGGYVERALDRGEADAAED